MNKTIQFYKNYGMKRLTERKKFNETKKELDDLKKILRKKDKILDLACGYGRITIPLFEKGYNIEGIDFCNLHLNTAKKKSSKKKLKIKFKKGDIKNLPYKKESFNKIICIWSAFLELTNKKDQIKTLKEVFRILRKKGFAFFDMYLPPTNLEEKIVDKIHKGYFKFDKKENVLVRKFKGVKGKLITYLHSKESLRNLIKESKIKKYKIYIGKFGGKNRLLVKIWK